MQYQEFGIEKIISHPHYNGTESDRMWSMTLRWFALIDTYNLVPRWSPFACPLEVTEKPSDYLLTVTGWGRNRNPMRKCSDSPTLDYLENRCNEQLSENGTRLCTFNSCCRDFGSPLMHMFAERRMVLEGIDTFGFMHCSIFAAEFTRVRSYADWLNDNMDMQ